MLVSLLFVSSTSLVDGFFGNPSLPILSRYFIIHDQSKRLAFKASWRVQTTFEKSSFLLFALSIQSNIILRNFFATLLTCQFRFSPGQPSEPEISSGISGLIFGRAPNNYLSSLTCHQIEFLLKWLAMRSEIKAVSKAAEFIVDWIVHYARSDSKTQFPGTREFGCETFGPTKSFEVWEHLHLQENRLAWTCLSQAGLTEASKIEPLDNSNFALQALDSKVTNRATLRCG